MTTQKETMTRIDYHDILDRLIAGYMLENSGSTPSSISAMDLIEWHHKKVKEEEEVNDN